MDRTKKSKDVAEFGSCAECGHRRNSEDRFCGRCGASLRRSLARRGELAPRAKESRVTLRERFLPRGLGPVGKTVVVGLTAVAADVGLAWLRHRLEKTDRSVLQHDVSRVWQEEVPRGEVPRGGPEYLHGYSLKEAALLVREGRETCGWFSSELTIGSSRVRK